MRKRAEAVATMHSLNCHFYILLEENGDNSGRCI